MEWGRLWRELLSVVGAISSILLFHDGGLLGSVGVVGRSGSGAIGSGTIGGGAFGSSIDVGLAGGFEFFECLLNKGGGVLVRAATFHGCSDVGPEVGVVSVFDFLLRGEKVLVLLVEWWLAGLRW